MKKLIIITLIAILAASLFAQTSVLVEFKYKNVVIETKELSDGKIEKTTRDFGLSDVNVQLRDLIVFKLIDKKINATSDIGKSTDYIVKLQSNINQAFQFYYYSLEIEMYKIDGSLVSRRLFRGAPGMNDFTEDLSSDIVTYIIETIKK